MKVDADKLIDFAKTLEGQRLETLTRKKGFRVLVTKIGMDYTPESTGKARHQYKKVIRDICDRFSETNSYAGSEYRSFTANASYVLALIDKYTNQ